MLVFEFVDEFDTIDFTNFADHGYRLSWDNWQPARASLVINELGIPEYTNVTERMGIQIGGQTAGVVRERLQRLSEMMDRAQMWSNGDTTVSPVLWRYQPTDSHLPTPLEVVILGLGGRSGLAMPSDFAKLSDGLVMQDVVLNFARRGRWLGSIEQRSSSVGGNPFRFTTSAFSRPFTVLCPYDLTVKFESPILGYYRIKILASGDSTNLLFAEAEGRLSDSAPVGNSWTQTAVSGASSGDVMRALAGAISPDPMKLKFDTNALNPRLTQVAAYAVVRNNSDSTYWTCRLRWGDDGPVSRTHVIDTDNFSNPNILELGIIADDQPEEIGLRGLTFEFQSADALGVGHELDVDYIALIGLDHSARVLEMLPFDPVAPRNVSVPKIKHRLLEDLAPIIHDETPILEKSVPFIGDARLSAGGDEISAVVFGTRSGGVGWTIENGAQMSIVADRQNAYLVPE